MAKETTTKGKSNPRYKNGSLRRKYRARLKAQGGPCGICNGSLGPIHYDEPSDWKHPFSFVVDEIIPVSRWKEYGYNSPEAAALDWNNLQPAHWCCNAAKSNKVIGEKSGVKKITEGATLDLKAEEIRQEARRLFSREEVIAKINIADGEW